MSTQVLIYGATGYTGRLIARVARERGLRPILAARNAAKLRPLAESLGFAHRVLHVEDTIRLAAGLADVGVVLNAAGPFSATSCYLVEACLRARAHYLDLAAEMPIFEALHRRDTDARARGIMIMPGVGFVVAPSDCLAAQLGRMLPGARHLAIGISRSTLISRGSAKTVIELLSDTIMIRRQGVIASVPAGHLEREFDYGRGPRRSAAVSWADVFTAYHTTRIPNVEVYLEVSPAERAALRLSSVLGPLVTAPPWRKLLEMQTGMLAEGPSESQREAHRRVIVAEAEDDAGRRISGRVTTPDPYTFTAVTALTLVERILQGHVTSGFQTPARVYGADVLRSCGADFQEGPTAKGAAAPRARRH